MTKNYFFVFIALIFFTPFFAQQQEEVLLDGLLVVPEGTSAEGIHVFNKSNYRGSVVTSGGRFEILAGQRDTLVFTGIQFKELEVEVTAGMLASGMIRMEIQEGINELPEVVIREHDLSGILSDDSKTIDTEDFEIPVVPPPIGPPTGVTTVHNSAINEISGGANLLGLLAAGVELLLPKRIKQPPAPRHNQQEQIKLRQKLRSLLGDEFFIDTLGLQKEEIGDFLEFSIGMDFDAQLLEEKQRIYLLQFLFDQKEAFQP